MIKKFINFINENYETGYFNYGDRPFKLDVKHGDTTVVRILYMDKHYEDLSIDIPDSKDLSEDEFFINPTLDEKLIEELEKQGFIECTNKTSMAGEYESKSYKLV